MAQRLLREPDKDSVVADSAHNGQCEPQLMMNGQMKLFFGFLNCSTYCVGLSSSPKGLCSFTGGAVEQNQKPVKRSQEEAGTKQP